ncbi:MAG TPA: hypothetical protein VMS21_04895, partial [Methylomirabilota bacterium]|nr:hypothetical protein [Methylomirabilota bacterium]
ASSPHSKTSPTSRGASRTSRQRFGVRLWASALYRFRMPDGRSSSALPSHALESGESASLHRRSQNVADIGTGCEVRMSIVGFGGSFHPAEDSLRSAAWNAVRSRRAIRS